MSSNGRTADSGSVCGGSNPPTPAIKIWPHRLTVRTPASHVGNPGSKPGGVTSLRFLTEATARQAIVQEGSEGCRVEASVILLEAETDTRQALCGPFLFQFQVSGFKFQGKPKPAGRVDLSSRSFKRRLKLPSVFEAETDTRQALDGPFFMPVPSFRFQVSR